MKMILACVFLIVCLGGCAGETAVPVELILPPYLSAPAFAYDTLITARSDTIALTLRDHDSVTVYIMPKDSMDSPYETVTLLKDDPVKVSTVKGQKYILGVQGENETDSYDIINIEITDADISHNKVPSLRRVIAENSTAIGNLTKEEITAAWGKGYAYDDGSLFYTADGSAVKCIFEDNVLKTLEITAPEVCTDPAAIGFEGMAYLVRTADGKGYIPVYIFHWADGALHIYDTDLLHAQTEFDDAGERQVQDALAQVTEGSLDRIQLSYTPGIIVPADELDTEVQNIISTEHYFILDDDLYRQNYVLKKFRFAEDHIVITE